MTTLADLQQQLRTLPAKLEGILWLEAAEVADRAQRSATDLAARRLTRRSGALERSIRARVVSMTSGAEVVLSSNAPHGRIQNEGGVVRPTRGRFLAIPLDAARAAGVHSPRQAPADLHFIPLRGGQAGLLVERLQGRGAGQGRGPAWFYLTRQVTIRPTRYLDDAMVEAQRGLAERVSQRAAALLGGSDGQ